ncbi:MAG: IclR family transcriptional regulator [Alcanivorax sp.]|uniref:uracil-DNA glycosylase family protein n=1 Tax=Alcanivorax sp. TaxID=1872427 RepID=UPI000C3B9DA4|nr:uracil-DNA glycosylase family protein [Alcanivorax sp.]MBB09897.1 IclR family transcriptional regulator [Alcanivorax sp.]MBU83926.1 IclR family transcriptional regulator [Alcanivorax sp.]
MSSLISLLEEVRACRLCEAHLPLGPHPVVRAGQSARLLIVGQAPGTRVHETGIPWNDPSGDRLRDWLQMDREAFYDENQIAIIPMGFCYPGRGKGGDLPPRPECAPQWHERLLAELPDLQLTLLVGQYAQKYYLPSPGKTLSDNVRDFDRALQSGYFPLPHPSPRNRLWLRQRPWFEEQVLPVLRERVKALFVKP